MLRTSKGSVADGTFMITSHDVEEESIMERDG
jgi:hypothetical protein